MGNVKKIQRNTTNINEEAHPDVDELNFSDDAEPSFATMQPEINQEEMSVIEGSDTSNEDYRHSTLDDIDPNELTPETLIKEDGARSPRETGSAIPAEEDLSVVGIDDIGAGNGLDEEELAQLEPLDENSSTKKSHRK
jgi:hypothetical protein